MIVFIDDTDRSSDVVRSSVKLNDNIQESPNDASFSLRGEKPSEYDEVRIFAGYKIFSATASSVTLDASYARNSFDLFRVGDILTVAIGLSDEETNEIFSIENSSGRIKINFTNNFLATPAQGEYAGKKEFAGNIVNIADKNIDNLQNIEYFISCLDYTRIFDKELINDTFEDRDARYIINSFCNNFINYNTDIDEMDYADNTAIQAEWIESGDGNNPTVDTTNFREGDSSGVFGWTFSGGTATFSATPSQKSISEFTGASSGTPTKGVLGFHYQCLDYTKVTNFKVRVGSDSSNYASITVVPTDNEFNFHDAKLKNATIVGNPNWDAMDYCAIVVTETASSSIRFDGIRILEEEFFRHWPYVGESVTFDDFRINRVKPTEVLRRIADELSWYWNIDYDRYIHLFNRETNAAPFTLSETSANFKNLAISYDLSKLINRQIVRGGDETSSTFYTQVEPADGVRREFLLKNKFKNLTVYVDNNSSTDLCEAGTTTTNIKATAHGLAEGDYIVNRTRSNAVRKILAIVDVDNFTVEAVASQTNGDTISKFIEKTVGIEGLDSDASFNYMSNFNQKSVRNAEAETTLISGYFILFKYNEVIPIIVQRSENISIQNLKSILGHTNGIFDGQPIIDNTIKSRSEAIQVAKAKLEKYSNVIISARFTTNYNGLKSGQLIDIQDTTSGARNIDQNFVIQKITRAEIEEGYYEYSVICSSLLFGLLELLQQILKQGRKIDVDEDAVIDNVEDAFEEVTITDDVTADVNGHKFLETLDVSDSVVASVFTPPFKYEPTGASVSRYNLASYG